MANKRVIGVDGCPSGWIGVARDYPDGADPDIVLFSSFDEVLRHPSEFAVVAVDMPIGLPEFITGPGRGAEQAVRPHLGRRRGSVFSIPSRAAVYEQNYGKACVIALRSSDPAKKFSKQGFNIFPKIREIDGLMTPALEDRVYEVHPELAFWRLNGEVPAAHPKKTPDGKAERRALLESAGFDAAFLNQKPPKGAAVDDFIDACVCCVMASRALSGELQPFPQDYERDAKGLRMAIWA